MQATRQTLKKITLLFVTLLLCAPAYAQSNDSLVVLFLSQPGVRPTQIFTDGFESGDVSRWDANGDGTTDLVLQRDDSQGNLQDIRVLDGRTRAVIWEVKDVPTTLPFWRPSTALWGFADLYGDGTPKALFYNDQDLVAYDLNPNEVRWSWGESNSGSMRFIGATDLTNDGLPELIIVLPDTKQVQVWGKGN